MKKFDNWQKRHINAEQTIVGNQIDYYPEETRLSKKASDPDTVNKRKTDIALFQEDIEGHLFIPYYHLPPYYARFIDGVNQTILAPSTSASIVNVTIPFKHAVIRWFGNNVIETGGIGNIVWSIRVNGARFDPWDAITLQLGTIALPSPVFINMVLGDVLTVLIANTGAANYTVQTRIKGWTW